MYTRFVFPNNEMYNDTLSNRLHLEIIYNYTKHQVKMIRSKQDYIFYLEADRLALGRKNKHNIRELLIKSIIFPDYVWNYQKLLRKAEYLNNCGRDIFDRIHLAIVLRKIDRVSIKLGYYIHMNNFGPGLSISHPGSIIINPAARIGSNCRIHPGAVIGTQAGYSDKAPKLGNNIYIGPGVKIFGSIEIADDIAIGANSVVNSSFKEPGITIAGIPAKKISNKGSNGLLLKASELLKNQ
jgi:serine O-acetyltransferase